MKSFKFHGKTQGIFALALALMLLVSVAATPVMAAETTVGKYTSDFSSLQEVVAAESELNKQIGAEGFVLLKNEGSNLPFAGNIKNISVFGKNSVNPVYSGSGSSGGTSGNTVSIIDSLVAAGFNVNPTLMAFYNDTEASGAVRPSMGFASYNYHSYFPTAETPLSSYTDAVKNSYAAYNDAAVIVFSRTGGEGTDLPRSSYVSEEYAGQVPPSGDARVYPTFEDLEDPNYKFYGGMGRESDPSEHYLELDDHEEALLEEVCAKFDKVVVIINSSNVMEIGSIIDNDKVQSIIWAPGAGQNGFDAIGKILNGEINPSGRTTDTFIADFTADPAYQNFSNNNIGYYADGTAGNQYLMEDGQVYENNFADFLGVEMVEYEEGIYLGYKYYETRGYTDGEAWYAEAVNYPFGYGLSYTEFVWEVGELKMDTDTLTEKTTLSVDVTVTNVGAYAGKDVVELYFSAPYTSGETEKAHVVLGTFEKTDILRPTESQTVTLTFTGFDMASFDAYDKDGDGHVGYELDAGTYTIYIGKNSHHAWTEGAALTVSGDELNIDVDPVSGADISALFQTSTNEMEGHVLSRADWEGTFPTTPTQDDLMKSDEWLANFSMPLIEGATADNAVLDTWYDEANPNYDGGQAPWYSATAPAFQPADQAYSADNPAPIQLVDMIGVALDDSKWDDFVSQLTVDQTYELMASTRFQHNAVDALGAPVAGHSDGPVGLTGAWVGGGQSLLKPFAAEHKFSFATETLVACTWNKDIARRQGELIGDYGLWVNIVGWYGPGLNIHRTPFSGRNFEYYSEDATLSAHMAAEVVGGARSKGMIVFMKHFALNDQENNRDTDGIATWADEQTMRENYFKVFEWAVKYGDGNGAMSSFNRIGFEWAGASYALLTQLLREEWGMEGVVITDAHSAGQGCMNASQMIRAGNDMSLDSREGSLARIVNSEESNTATQLTALHNAAKNILYTQLNSAAMNNGYVNEALGYSETSVNAAGATFTAVQGQAFTASVADETSTDDQYVIFLGKLPEGLSFNGQTGEITGTVSANAPVGDYTIQVTKTQKGVDLNGEAYIVSGNVTGGFGGINGLTRFTITVADDGVADVAAPVSVTGFSKLGTIGSTDYYMFTYSDGTEDYFTVTNGTDGVDGVDGVDGADGANGADGAQGAAGENGDDASNVLSIVALIVGIAGIAVGGVSLIGKKKQ